MKPKKSGRRLVIDLLLATKCQSCGTNEKTVTYDRTTRTGSVKRTTRCINCK